MDKRLSLIYLLVASFYSTDGQYTINYQTPDQHRNEIVDVHGNLRTEYGFVDPTGKNVHVTFSSSPSFEYASAYLPNVQYASNDHVPLESFSNHFFVNNHPFYHRIAPFNTRINSLFDKVKSSIYPVERRLFTPAIPGEAVATKEQMETVKQFMERDIAFSKNMTAPTTTPATNLPFYSEFDNFFAGFKK